MTGRYSINGQDLYSTYGIIVTGGLDTFLAPNERKEPFSKDWGDSDGIEYDLSSVVLQARTFKIEGYIIASSLADFNTKFNALKTVLNSTGYLVITVGAIEDSFTAFCKSVPDFRGVTKRIKNSDKLGFFISMEFAEVMNTVQLSLNEDLNVIATSNDFTAQINDTGELIISR